MTEKGEDYADWSREALVQHLQAVSASRDRFADLFELAPLAYVICDIRGTVRRANAEAGRQLGISPDELTQRPLADLLLGRGGTALGEFLQHLYAGGGETSVNLPMRGLRGGVATLSVKGRVAPDPQSGEPLARLTLEDISHLKEAQLMQQRANRALRALNATNQAVRWAEDEGVLLDEISRFLVKDAGYVLAWVGEPNYDAERSIQVRSVSGDGGYLQAIADRFTWDARGGRPGPFASVMHSGKPVLISDIGQDPAFEPWREEALAHGLHSVLVLPLRREERPFGALAIYAGDVDSFDAYEMGLLCRLADELANGWVALRAREARERAERERDRLRELLNATPDLVSIAEPDGCIRYVNPGALRLVGLPPEADVVGRYAWEFHTDWSVELLRQEGIPTAVREGVWQGETALLDVHRGEIPLSQVLVAHRGEDGQVEALSTMARDLTELRRHQGELERSRRLVTMGELSSVLAHQLNQPLAAATNFAEGALNRLDRGEVDKLRYGLEQIRTNTHKAGRIIWDIRNFLSGGELQLRLIDLNQLIHSLVPSMQQARRQSGYRVKLALADELPGVSCDPILVQECLTNLFHNAVESMEATDTCEDPAKRITIGTRLAGAESVEVYVSDRGKGLPAGLREELVQPLFTTKSGGMGLGISVCRSIVEAHEGRFWATENRAGAGTTFHFTLPLTVALEQKEGAPDGE